MFRSNWRFDSVGWVREYRDFSATRLRRSVEMTVGVAKDDRGRNESDAMGWGEVTMAGWVEVSFKIPDLIKGRKLLPVRDREEPEFGLKPSG